MLVKNRIPVDHHFKIEITTDQGGRITLRQDNGPSLETLRPKGGRRRSFSEEEMEKLLDAGGGRLDTRALTPQQKELLAAYERNKTK